MARDPRICLRKPQQRAFRWFWSMSRKFVRGRNICWRWTRVVASSSKFLPSSRELVLLPLRDEKRDSSLEQIRSAFSGSDDLRRLATFNCKKIFPNSRVWIERSSSSWPPGRRRSGLLKSALDSEPVFRRQLPHSQRDARADQVVPASTSHQARSAPAGETGAGPATCLWETNHRGYRR